MKDMEDGKKKDFWGIELLNWLKILYKGFRRNGHSQGS
jgi:hypothetical protein